MSSSAVFAQGHVTLYGSLGLAARYKTHATPEGSAGWGLGPSPNAAGIWGVWGTEELGAGMKTHFNLESGFDLYTGTLSYSGLAWGREATVGLTTAYGRFDIGRLQVQGLAAQSLVMADPMRAGGSFAETLWPGLYTGNRFDNALRWRAKVGAVFGSLYGAFGEQSVPSRGAGRTPAAASDQVGHQVPEHQVHRPVEAVGGLVEYQQRRPVQDRGEQLDLLVGAAAELADRVREVALQLQRC
jgi:predicted porin